MTAVDPASGKADVRQRHATMDDMWGSMRTPITAADLAPPLVPDPRPWIRVPVPAAVSAHFLLNSSSTSLCQRIIWKRVGSRSPSLDELKYVTASRELGAYGAGSRKRARLLGYVPPLADGRWDKLLTAAFNGVKELVEARATVTASAEESAATAPYILKTTPATFPEEKLVWVPRKRHNTRWPIDPTTKSPTMLFDRNPLTQLFSSPETPENAEKEEPVQKVDDKQIRRRSTRRLSRRISLAPIEECIEEGATLDEQSSSPEKAIPSHSSPAKRRGSVANLLLVYLSPVKVSDCPARSFTISATPSKVTMDPSLSARGSPTKSLSKVSALSPISESQAATLKHAPEGALSPLVPPASNVVFHQPTPEVVDEPQHEVMRRSSLANARRRSSGSLKRMVDFEMQQRINRRHSFALPSASTKPQNWRRHSLELSCFGTEINLDISSPDKENMDPVIPQTNNCGSEKVSKTPLKSMKKRRHSTVDVDVRTNLDIFGRELSSPGASPTKFDTVDCRRFDLGPSLSPTRGGQLSWSPRADSPDPGDEIFEEEVKNALGITMCEFVNHTNTAPESSNLPTATEEIEHVSATAVAGNLSPTAKNEHEDESGEDESPETLCKKHETIVLTSENPGPDADELMSEINRPELTKPTPPHEQDRSLTPESDEESEGGECGSGAPLGLDTESSEQSIQEPLSVVAPDDSAVASLPSSADVEDADDTIVLSQKSTPQSLDDIDRMLDEMDSPTQDLADLLLTPPQDGAKRSWKTEGEDIEGDIVFVSPSGGFTPINVHIGPKMSASSPTPEGEQREDETMTITLDVTTTVEDPEATMTVELDLNATETMTAHDDSETELLRNFVTRVKADKNAKAAAAAAAAACANARSIRRPGSVGSMTSATGSPADKTDPVLVSPSKRVPLGAKDINMSPSPTKKKRKDIDGSDVPMGKGGRERLSKPSLDDSSPPKPKRRRKRTEVETDSILNPEWQTQMETETSDTGPRRSSRTRNRRIPLKPTGQTANSAAGVNPLSLIPVRLPGMMGHDGGDIGGFSLAMRRNEEKDLAAVTRVNTRKNKSGAVPPRTVLARQTDDPRWKMKELKGVFDAREAAAAAAAGLEDEMDESLLEGTAQGKRRTRRAKEVRWAETLVRIQGEDVVEVAVVPPSSSDSSPEAEAPPPDAATEVVKASPATIVAAEPEEVMPASPGAQDEKIVTVAAAPVPAPTPAPVTEPSEVMEEMKVVDKPVAKRTRASKLQLPTPVSKLPKAAAAAATTTGTASTTAAARKLPSGSASRPPVRMATRRAKVSGLGMAGNGTPAPKRRTRATAS